MPTGLPGSDVGVGGDGSLGVTHDGFLGVGGGHDDAGCGGVAAGSGSDSVSSSVAYMERRGALVPPKMEMDDDGGGGVTPVGSAPNSAGISDGGAAPDFRNGGDSGGRGQSAASSRDASKRRRYVLVRYEPQPNPITIRTRAVCGFSISVFELLFPAAAAADIPPP